MKFASVTFFALALLFVVSFSTSKSYAQARPSPATQVVSVDIVPLVYNGSIMFQYEYKTDPVTSWMLRLHYWPTVAQTANWSAFGAGAAYRIYIADSRALTGLAVAPAADIFFFSQSQQTGGTGSRSAIGFDLGGDLSYKWIFDQFAVEPIVGLRFGIGGASVPGYFTTIEPVIGASLGYAW
jgi:hypothetical protein